MKKENHGYSKNKILRQKLRLILIIKKEISHVNQNESTSNLDKFTALEKLGTLLEKGILTKKEFENEKNTILGSNEGKIELEEGTQSLKNENLELIISINLEIEKTRKGFFVEFNSNLANLLQSNIKDDVEARAIINEYSEHYKTGLIKELIGLTSSYDEIKEYLKPFIDFGIVSNKYPHDFTSY